MRCRSARCQSLLGQRNPASDLLFSAECVQRPECAEGKPCPIWLGLPIEKLLQNKNHLSQSEARRSTFLCNLGFLRVHHPQSVRKLRTFYSRLTQGRFGPLNGGNGQC